MKLVRNLTRYAEERGAQSNIKHLIIDVHVVTLEKLVLESTRETIKAGKKENYWQIVNN